MDLHGLEAFAVETYERCGLDAAKPVSTFRIARLLFGPSVICRDATLVGPYPAASALVAGVPRIAIRRTVPLDEQQFYVAHELGHLLLPDQRSETIEAECDYFAAALMAPRPAVFSLHRAFGWNLRAIAEEVVGTQTWAALRLGEALRAPLAAVSPVTVRVRGPEDFAWPEETTIRRWARKPGPGLRKVAITDRPRRAVLLAEG